MDQIYSIFKTVGVTGLIDILCMSVLIYILIIWFKKSKAIFVLIGLFIVGIVYLAAREFNLQLMAAVLQGFFAVILLVIIVIFKEELKQMFERLAVWSLNRGTPGQKVLSLSRKEIEILVRTLTDLAEDNIGALVVLRGQDTIVRHVNGGWDLGGEMSEPLLKSLFDPHSIGHDGAVVIDGDRILQFGCHLPLSKDLKKIPKGGGTRHAAGLGLAELTDALCVIVSEERGTISVARFGEIEIMADAEKLSQVLNSFYEEMSPSTQNQTDNIFTKNWREKLTAFLLTIGLWFFFVHESRLTYKAIKVPLEYSNLPAELEMISIKPEFVEITFSGPRRNFYFLGSKRVRAVLNMVGQTEGFRSKFIQKSNVSFPDKLELEAVVPQKVTVATRLKSGSSPTTSSAASPAPIPLATPTTVATPTPTPTSTPTPIP